MTQEERKEQKKQERKARLAQRKADPRTMREKVYDEIAKYVSVKTMDYIIWGLVGLFLLIVLIGLFV
ncbi:MAG: hypothetical protein ACOYBE_06905 [Blautia sp.]|jgi:uncharacterized membrane protein